MCLLPWKRDAVYFLQPLRISKGNTCNTCSKPARVDAQDQVPEMIVTVLLPVKLFSYGPDLWIKKRIHYMDAIRKGSFKLQITIEIQDFIGEGHTFILIRIYHNSIFYIFLRCRKDRDHFFRFYNDQNNWKIIVIRSYLVKNTD
jgi:hypothetical protein